MNETTRLIMQQLNTKLVQGPIGPTGSQGPKGDKGADGTSGGILSYATLSDLQAAFPYGSTTPAWVVADNSWYYWNGVVIGDTTAPTIIANPVAGTYMGTQSVQLTANESATIYYTTDGSTPTVSSSVYSSAIPVSATGTIKAIGKDTAGNVSAPVSFAYTINTVTIPGTPSTPTATAGNNKVDLGWTAVSGATSYKVYRGGTLLASPTTNSYSDTTALNGTAYSYTVSAINTAGESAQSSAASATPAAPPVDTTAPNPVTALAAGTPTANSVPLSWTISSSGDVSVQEAAYSTDGTNFTVASAVINAASNTYTVVGLTANTAYTFRVVAIDAANNRSTAVTTTATTLASSTIIVSDSFNRADDSTTLGNSETGQAWVTYASSTWGISANTAYMVSGSGNGGVAAVDAGASDCTVQFKLGSITNGRLAVRVLDGVQYFGFQPGGTGYSCYRWNAGGGFTKIGDTTGVTIGVGKIIKCVMSGNNFKFYVDNVLGMEFNDANYNTQTKHGIGSATGSPANKFDDFKISIP